MNSVTFCIRVNVKNVSQKCTFHTLLMFSLKHDVDHVLQDREPCNHQDAIPALPSLLNATILFLA